MRVMYLHSGPCVLGRHLVAIVLLLLINRLEFAIFGLSCPHYWQGVLTVQKCLHPGPCGGGGGED